MKNPHCCSSFWPLVVNQVQSCIFIVASGFCLCVAERFSVSKIYAIIHNLAANPSCTTHADVIVHTQTVYECTRTRRIRLNRATLTYQFVWRLFGLSRVYLKETFKIFATAALKEVAVDIATKCK